MGISFECGNCGKAFNVAVENAGKTGRCKQCGVTMQIPLASEAAPETDLYDLDEPVVPPPPVAAVAAAAPTGGRPGTSGGGNPEISKLAAQIRAKQAGTYRPEPKEKSGFSWGRVGSVLLTALVVMGVVSRVIRPLLRARQGVQQNKPLNRDQAIQVIQTDIAKYANGPIALPRFPDLGPGEEKAPGVTCHEVVFGPSPLPLEAPPGQGGKLWVYLPTGEHAPHSLPCVMITGAGSNLLTGMDLGEGDRKEQLPYVTAGFAVVAFELDGVNHDETQSDQKMTEAMWRFDKARAGLINAHIALEYTLAKVPAIDPSRISIAGHSSAGALAVLFAETEPRLKSAVAFAPALNYEERFGKETSDAIKSGGFGPLVVQYAPITGVANLKCPLLLFHARDDSNVPVAQAEEFASKAESAGKSVTLDLVDTGDHYNSMIREGIPHAIAWLKGEPIPPRPRPDRTPRPRPGPRPTPRWPPRRRRRSTPRRSRRCSTVPPR